MALSISFTASGFSYRAMSPSTNPISATSVWKGAKPGVHMTADCVLSIPWSAIAFSHRAFMSCSGITGNFTVFRHSSISSSRMKLVSGIVALLVPSAAT